MPILLSIKFATQTSTVCMYVLLGPLQCAEVPHRHTLKNIILTTQHAGITVLNNLKEERPSKCCLLLKSTVCASLEHDNRGLCRTNTRNYGYCHITDQTIKFPFDPT